MGGHYGTIHVRTEDRDGVRSAVEGLACKRASRFLIAPSINGWVTIYPERNGQDPTVSEALAAKLPDNTLIHCLVHDDDVFAYWLFERGRIVDTYNSCPDFFGNQNPPPRGGNARALGHLLIDSRRVNELQELLDAKRFDFELERQDQFAALLGLPNTAYAYEYLQAGETDGVRQWKKFTHVPDLAPEKAARRAAAAKVRGEFKRLQREGILLADVVAEKSGNKHFFKAPVWVIDPANSAAILSWHDYMSVPGTEKVRLHFCGPDWKAENWNGGALGHAEGLQFSPSGSLCALQSRDGSFEIWDVRQQQLVTKKQFKGGIVAMAFSADEGWLFAIVHGNPPPAQIHRIALRSGMKDGVLEDESLHFQALSVHPDGQLLSVVDHSGILVVISLETMRMVNQVWIKEVKSLIPEGVRQALVARGMGKFLAELKNHLPTGELERYRQQCDRNFLPKEPIRLCTFSPDGELLFCGTSGGLRGLRWEDVLACHEMQPVPVHISVDAESVVLGRADGFSTEHKFVYGIAFDALRQRVLFSGLEGKVTFLELNNRRSGTLLVSPDKAPLIQLALTPNRAALVATSHRFDIESHKQTASRFQIWNYGALCRAVGLEH